MSIKLQKMEPKRINGTARVKLKTTGTVMEIVSMERTPKPPPTKKISADEYVYLETGEIAQYQKAESKADSLQSVRRSLALGRDLINANFTGAYGEKMYTFTYRENMTDLKRLYRDFQNLMYKIKGKYGQLVWVTAVEPQARGAWHTHMLMKSATEKPLWIDSRWLYEAWGHGAVYIVPLKEVDNVGAYLSGYLANLVSNDGQGDAQDKNGVRYKKGHRLCMYPPGMKIFRCSRNCKRPEVEEMTYQKAKEKVCGATQTYVQRVEIIDQNGISVNEIQHEYYNIKRVKTTSHTA